MNFEIDGKQGYAFTGGRTLDPSKPSVMFVHGAAMDHTVWALPTRYFVRHGYNVLSVDLPGHGRSEGAPAATLSDAADWVIRLLHAAGLERTALVGHSMGSLVALEAAARHPDQVRALVLIGSAVPMAVTDALLSNAQADDHMAIDMLTIWGYSRGAQLGGNETPGMWMVGGTMRLLERSAPGILYNDLNACNEYRHGMDSAKQVQCPTMLILGDEDMMTPPVRGKDIAGAIPDSRIVLLKSSGHSLMSEKPDAVLDALIEIV
ncbi:MAG: alpha/beta hydrolase [Gammaproteobacteria bacterium]|nr:alpha/beta hydrolase [Gammaproteobacteria bacterium]MDH3466141.1 alpha/beta hydrolase [Gammaproteobacteria bacterium]